MKLYSGDAAMYFKFFSVEGETPAEAALHAIEQGEAIIWDTMVYGVTEETEEEE